MRNSGATSQLRAWTANPASSAPKAVIFLMRHGETDLEEADCYETDDAPLNERGLLAPAKAAKLLRIEFITQVYSSPLLRARQTAELMVKELGLMKETILFDSLLGPLDVGKLAGKSKITHSITPYVDNEALTFPGGENISTFRQDVAYLIRALVANAPTRGNILAVTHSTVVTAALDAYDNRRSRLVENARVRPGGLVQLRLGDFCADRTI